MTFANLSKERKVVTVVCNVLFFGALAATIALPTLPRLAMFSIELASVAGELMAYYSFRK